MKKNSLSKSSFKGFLWVGGIKLTNAIFQFLILAILARILAPEEFGLITIALLVLGFSDIFSDLGVGPAITQKSIVNSKEINTGFTFSIFLGIFLTIFFFILSKPIALYFDNLELIEILQTISIVIFLKSITTVPLGLLYRDLEYKKLSLIQIISYIMGYGLPGIILAYFGYGVWALVYAVIIQSVLSAIFYLFYSPYKFMILFDFNSFKDLIHYGGGYSLGKIFSYFSSRVDQILVGKMFGAYEIGLYGRGIQVVKFPASLIGEIIDKVLFSPFAKKQKDKEHICSLVYEMIFFMSIVFIPFSIFIYLNSTQIVHVLLGNDWNQVVDIVKIMSPTFFFLIATRLSSTIAKSLGDVYNRAFRSFINGCFVVISVYFASYYDIKFVTLTVTIGIFFNYIFAFFQLKKLINLNLFLFTRSHFLGLLAAFIYSFIFKLFFYLFDNLKNIYTCLFFSVILLLITYVFVYFLDFNNLIKKYYKILLKNEKN